MISNEWNTIMISTEGDPPERDLQTEGNAMSTEGDPPGTRFTDWGECDVYRGGPPRNVIYRPRGMRCLPRGTPPERDLPTEGNAIAISRGTHTSIPPKARNTIAISTQGDYSEWICCTGGPETIAAPLIVNVKISPICKQFVLHSIKYE